MTDVLIACDMIVGFRRDRAEDGASGPHRGDSQHRRRADRRIPEQQEHGSAAKRNCARPSSTRSMAAPLFDLHASKLATELTGDSIGTNILMLGYAAQKGLLPVSIASIQEAIRLNGTFVEGNLRTFALGRLAAHAPDALAQELGDKSRSGAARNRR